MRSIFPAPAARRRMQLLSGGRMCRICGRSKAPASREQDAAKYESRVCVTAETFAETLRALDASVQLSGDPSGWVQSVTRTPGGGVDTLTAGGRPFFRRSTPKGIRAELHEAFTLLYEDGAFSFDVLGYGHRVGMSQYGADAIARLGFDYRTILRFYYRGAELTTLDF